MNFSKPLALALWLGVSSSSASLFSLNPTSDSFVTTGPSSNLGENNYGGAGAISLSAPLTEGELQSVMRYDLTAAKANFDGIFGVGQWAVESVTLRLNAAPGNNPVFNTVAAGNFAVDWMMDDTWIEGTGSPASPSATGINFNSLQSIVTGSDQNLGTFSFNGATGGAAAYTLGLSFGLVNDILAGGQTSLRLYAADGSISYIFNSRNFGVPASRPLLSITAEMVPEPRIALLVLPGLLLVPLCRRRRKM